MEGEKIKEGIEHFIGKERLMTNELKNQILTNAQNGSKRKRGVFMNFFRPVLSIAILLIVFGGMCYLIADDNRDGETAAEAEGNELLEKALLENDELKEQLEQLGTSEELQEAIHEIERLKEQIQDLSESNRDESLLDSLHLYRLKENGFTGNEKDIIAEFVLHPEIIPYDGMLGGTMGLSEEARVLSHEWILAPFSDGHVVGHLLVKYKMRDGIPTEWEVIDSYIDGEELD